MQSSESQMEEDLAMADSKGEVLVMTIIYEVEGLVVHINALCGPKVWKKWSSPLKRLKTRQKSIVYHKGKTNDFIKSVLEKMSLHSERTIKCSLSQWILRQRWWQPDNTLSRHGSQRNAGWKMFFFATGLFIYYLTPLGRFLNPFIFWVMPFYPAF